MWEEVGMMNRRAVVGGIAASLPFFAIRSALAQQGGLGAEELMRIVGSPPALDQLILESDTLWNIMALNEARRRGQPPSPEERRIYFNGIRAQIASPDQRNVLLGALQSSEGRERAAQAAVALGDTVRRLRDALVEIGLRSEAPLIQQLVRAFTTVTQLLSARSATNDRWYCHVFGFEILC
jgi:hypothetical protein